MKTITVKIYAVCITVLLAVMLIWDSIDRRQFERELIDGDRIFYDKVAERALVGPGEHFRKHVDFYNKIIGWYGPQYRKGKRGMSHKQRSKFVINLYDYNKMLGLPYFDVISIALIESYYDPFTVGPFNEGGMFQMRPGAVAQAVMYHGFIKSKHVRDRLRFNYGKDSDLRDPLNQLKMACVLLWGYRRQYANDPSWYVSSYHWGGIMDRYWRKKIQVPKEFVFNKGTVREDVRDPFVYYFMWANIEQAFSHFRKDIYVYMPPDYIKKWKESASELEVQFVQSWKYVKQLNDKVKKIEEMEQEFNEERKIELAKLRKLTDKANEEYQRLHSKLKIGNFKSVKDVWFAGRVVYRQMIKDIAQEKMGLHDRVTLYILATLGILLFIFSMVGLWSTGRRLWRVLKRRKAQR